MFFIFIGLLFVAIIVIIKTSKQLRLEKVNNQSLQEILVVAVHEPEQAHKLAKQWDAEAQEHHNTWLMLPENGGGYASSAITR
ncbi:hypothetical protein [Pseudovibrio sp. Ad37]|uniref:hypothetical protein n=1 Tax=Pseudovibrio sp. Ad37 TaxID=989422 RepID=UPI0007AEB0DA|nr:hypothetical protein [Pseudovibrio sp. Ad37]KZL24258.1 hypothetical protein PsAD37_02829 [Pseudovibrio sp. Ad37]